MDIQRTDVLIVGGGISGMTAADLLSNEKEVTLLTKNAWQHSNSMKAQGGIAAAISKEDDWSDHLRDTLTAGDSHNHEEATKRLVQKGINLVQQLDTLGVPFDRDGNGNLSLGIEGAHGKRRILHAGGDATGKAVMNTLIRKVRPKIKLRESEVLADLIIDHGRCIGVITKNQNHQNNIYLAEHIILATGGAGNLYEVTSNDETITGDGIAAAYRAGVSLTDMEFVQFHPTMLTTEQRTYGLISEAVRGEGARLLTEDGKYVMDDVHPKKDLAPRDVVARALHNVISSGHKVFLDISMIPSFATRFPTVARICENAGISVDSGRIPVAPGAHFLMGGIVTDTAGKTSLPGLYAVGETACTGVHGANRLASNSLLEGIVFATETAQAILTESTHAKKSKIGEGFSFETNGQPRMFPEKRAIQTIMSKHSGIIREKSGLCHAVSWFEQYLPHLEESVYQRSAEEIEHMNLLTVGWLITTSALKRTESRGGHFRKDYPNKRNQWAHKRITRRKKREQPQIANVAANFFS